jgi:hypothetical protein
MRHYESQILQIYWKKRYPCRLGILNEMKNVCSSVSKKGVCMKTKNKEIFVLGVLWVFCFMLAGCASSPKPLTNADIDRGITIFWPDDTITWAEQLHTSAYYGVGASRAALTSTQTDQQKIQWEFVGCDFEFDKSVSDPRYSGGKL